MRTVSLVLFIALCAAVLWFFLQRQTLPGSMVSSNGRLEAAQTDVASKVGGRLAAVLVKEGDDVQTGQILARLDADDLAAQVRAAQAQVAQARQGVSEARIAIRKASDDLALSQKNLRRTQELIAQGFISEARLDQDRSLETSARSALAQAQSRLTGAQAAVDVAQARSDSLQINLKDTEIKAPISGRVLYQFVRTGEIVAAGSKLVTLLDMRDVAMPVYLPATEAGKIGIGDAAYLVLDALPDQAIPAQVSFISPRAQFTPKEVETRNEREKLMFRVKVQVDAGWLASNARLAKPGMPGMAWLRTDAAASWPAALKPSRP